MATDARLSQLIAEILRTGTAVEAQLSQVVAEVLRANVVPTAARVTQQVVEVLSMTTPAARVTQQAAEVLTHENPATGIRVEQHVVEVLATTDTPVRVTQHVLEGLWTENLSRGALVTQHLLEVLWMDAPVPVPPLAAADATVQFHASLRAELLLEDARILLERALALGAEWGEIVEVVLPDGTLHRPVLPARAGRLTALLVVSDKAVQVCVGDVVQNQALTLQPWGVYALLGGDVRGEGCCTLSYMAGDGSTATCVVLALLMALPQPQVLWTEPWEVFIQFNPVLLWTEPWEV